MTWILIGYVYIQTFSKGDYPALVKVGEFKNAEVCQRAAAAFQQMPGIGSKVAVCIPKEN